MGIRAVAVDGVVVISCLNSNTKIHFVGASCLASVMPDSHCLESVTLSPEKDQKAVVALTTTCQYAKSPTLFSGGILELCWKDGKLFVNCDKDFVSPADRLGQVLVGPGEMLVSTRGQVFSTCGNKWGQGGEKYYEQEKADYRAKGTRIVPDANLLCRYLVGRATFEELEAVASGDMRTAEQIEINSLRTLLTNAGNRLISENNRLNAEMREAYAEMTRLKDIEQERNTLKVKLDATLGARIKRFRERIHRKVFHSSL